MISKKKALDHFSNHVVFPSGKDEFWRYSNIYKIVQKSYQPLDKLESVSERQKELINHHIHANCGADGKRIMVFNGYLIEELSDLSELKENGIQVFTFKQIFQDSSLKEHAERLQQMFELFPPANYFEWLNRILFSDGVFIYSEKNAKYTTPVHVLRVADYDSAPHHMLFTKTMAYASAGSELCVCENHLSHDDAQQFINGTINFKLEAKAKAYLVHIQNEPIKTNYSGFNAIHLEESSFFKSVLMQMGSINAVEQTRVSFAGENANCELNAASLGIGAQVFDEHTLIDHAKPNCNSYQFYKSLLKDTARFNFNGKIHVHKDAQKIDAYQMNRNLSLNKNNHVNTRPQLVIQADDVKCSHGATIGPLNSEEIFYLQSRGFSKQMAIQILSYAFIKEVLLKIDDQALQDNIKGLVDKYFYSSK